LAAAETEHQTFWRSWLEAFSRQSQKKKNVISDAYPPKSDPCDNCRQNGRKRLLPYLRKAIMMPVESALSPPTSFSPPSAFAKALEPALAGSRRGQGDADFLDQKHMAILQYLLM
jgi:hypothetical protein